MRSTDPTVPLIRVDDIRQLCNGLVLILSRELWSMPDAENMRSTEGRNPILCCGYRMSSPTRFSSQASPECCKGHQAHQDAKHEPHSPLEACRLRQFMWCLEEEHPPRVVQADSVRLAPAIIKTSRKLE